MHLPRSRSRRALHGGLLLLLITASAPALAQTAPLRSSDPPSIVAQERAARRDLAACRAYPVADLPGSHRFTADFLETIVTDPAPRPFDVNTIWALSADLDASVPETDRALYLSRSDNGGRTWRRLARIGPRYYDANISEGQRNGLAVTPGGRDFVITTQDGAFRLIPQRDPDAPVIQRIPGPVVPAVRPDVVIAKKTGDPVRAGVVLITADGQRMIIAYGYFDDNPQLFTYHRASDGSWIEDGTLPHLPTRLDIFSMQFDTPRSAHPGALYAGTGDQAYRLDLRTLQWKEVMGVGPDSAIHSISTVDGLHLAACWGVYTPVNDVTVARVTTAHFLLHRWRDEVGPNLRTYGIAVDPSNANRLAIAAITGVYISRDAGHTWQRLNDLPEGEYHSVRFNSDGTVLVSGYVGTFLVNPFSESCAPHLERRSSLR